MGFSFCKIIYIEYELQGTFYKVDKLSVVILFTYFIRFLVYLLHQKSALHHNLGPVLVHIGFYTRILSVVFSSNTLNICPTLLLLSFSSHGEEGVLWHILFWQRFVSFYGGNLGSGE